MRTSKFRDSQILEILKEHELGQTAKEYLATMASTIKHFMIEKESRMGSVLQKLNK